MKTVNDFIKETILEALQDKALTAKELRKFMPDVATSSLYKALSQLQYEDKIKANKRLSGRDVQFTLADTGAARVLIPSLTYEGNRLAAIYFLLPEAFLETNLSTLNLRIIGSLARIMEQARLVKEGQSKETTTKNLKRIKSTLKKGEEDLKELFSLIEQILNEPRFWDPDLLIRFSADEKWAPEKVQHALDYFGVSQ